MNTGQVYIISMMLSSTSYYYEHRTGIYHIYDVETDSNNQFQSYTLTGGLLKEIWIHASVKKDLNNLFTACEW